MTSSVDDAAVEGPGGRGPATADAGGGVAGDGPSGARSDDPTDAKAAARADGHVDPRADADAYAPADASRPARRASRRARMQKSRANQSVDPNTMAKYTAARVFLAGMWFGATLMLASFTQLYWFTFARPDVGPRWPVSVGAAMLALGAWAFWKNRRYYHDLDFPMRRRLATAADAAAGAGAFFWLLFAFLWVLTALGQPVLGD
jgi:hypothetical protein